MNTIERFFNISKTICVDEIDGQLYVIWNENNESSSDEDMYDEKLNNIFDIMLSGYKDRLSGILNEKDLAKIEICVSRMKDDFIDDSFEFSFSYVADEENWNKVPVLEFENYVANLSDFELKEYLMKCIPKVHRAVATITSMEEGES